jgi:DNA-binding HxlR family transcriptional regulator
MARRSYDQFCPLACALDLLGERWTLLVVRDLIGGPKRYTDLARGLPGLATDLLTERLRRLEEADIVARRELPPPGVATVYELTPRAREELVPAVLGLARFGIGLLGDSPPGPPSPDQLALMLGVLFDPAGAPDESETWMLDGGGVRLAFSANRDGFEVHGPADELPRAPAATLAGEVPLLYDVIVGRRDAADALGAGELAVEGDVAALGRMRAAFPVPA